MEIILSFFAGLLVTAVIAFFIARYIIKDQQRRNAAALENAERTGREALEASEAAHKASFDALQSRFDETVAKLSAQLKADTNEMLKVRQKEFSESSSQSIEQMLSPFKNDIQNLRKALDDENKDQERRSGQMSEHIRNLLEQSEATRKSADDLTNALRQGRQVQGGWGETILEELLSSQGLTKGVHFDTQAVIRDAAGNVVHTDDNKIMRPDVILHLDSRREVIIDSKVSLTSYIDYVNAENEADRQKYLKAHIDSIKKHVGELAGVDYSSYVQAPKVSAGYVLMFVPNMGALWTALNAEPDLWRKAADKNVYIVDEQSLYGTLKLVNINWTQITRARSHEQVFTIANEMVSRVGMFMDQYRSVGSALEDAMKHYGKGMDKLSPHGQSILNSAGKLIKMGARTNARYPLPELMDMDDVPALGASGEAAAAEETVES